MTFDQLREMDFKKIIENLHWDYMRDFYNAERSLKQWAEDGKPIKKLVMEQVRDLCCKAVKMKCIYPAWKKS